MAPDRNTLINELRQEICRLGGTRTPRLRDAGNLRERLAPLNTAFPNQLFPLHALHEFICPSPVARASSIGFLSVILSCLDSRGCMIWVSEKMRVFPPALSGFGLNPSRFIFIPALKEKDRIWVMEEALKCRGLTALVGESRFFDFNISRRLQLGTENFGISTFILRENPSGQSTASTARWKISPIPSRQIDDLPGPGYPAWKVELLRLKNGKGRSWNIFYADGSLRLMDEIPVTDNMRHLKTG